MVRKVAFFLVAFGMIYGVASEVGAGQKEDMMKLAEQKGCLACHQLDKKVVGPAWMDIAKKYSEKDIDKLVNSVLNGSTGKWGNVPMPGNKGIVTEEEARKLVKFILSLKKKKK